MKQPAVYIMASRRNGTIYTGVTSDLPSRVWQHREGVTPGFSKRHGCKLLVWYELHGGMEQAILREKQLKGGSRPKKLALIGYEPGLGRPFPDTVLSAAVLCSSLRGAERRGNPAARRRWIAALRSQ